MQGLKQSFLEDNFNLCIYETSNKQTNKQTNNSILLLWTDLIQFLFNKISVFTGSTDRIRIIGILAFFTISATSPLSAQSPYISSSSGTNNLCTGATITLSGNYVYNYKQWQEKTGGVWTDVTGATGSSYNVTAAGEYRLRTSTVVSFSPQTITNEITASNATAVCTNLLNCKKIVLI